MITDNYGVYTKKYLEILNLIDQTLEEGNTELAQEDFISNPYTLFHLAIKFTEKDKEVNVDNLFFELLFLQINNIKIGLQ